MESMGTFFKKIEDAFNNPTTMSTSTLTSAPQPDDGIATTQVDSSTGVSDTGASIENRNVSNSSDSMGVGAISGIAVAVGVVIALAAGFLLVHSRKPTSDEGNLKIDDKPQPPIDSLNESPVQQEHQLVIGPAGADDNSNTDGISHAIFLEKENTGKDTKTSPMCDPNRELEC